MSWIFGLTNHCLTFRTCRMKLKENIMDDRLLPENHESRSPLSIWKAIAIGWLFVNIPALIIILSITITGFNIATRLWWLWLIISVVLGWTWWSYTIPRWRRWAHRNGTPLDKLHKVAVLTGLVWPKGSILEKTEAKINE